jgi:peptidoglycan/xylan/chitin deacetylase (PgdA/CDA1 family)
MPQENNSYMLPVLLYHRLVNKDSQVGRHKIYVNQSDFERQMEYLKNKGYETITFRDLSQDPSLDLYKKVILTFDDGYEDNYSLLFPILKRYGFTAVIYLVTQAKSNLWGMAEGEPVLNLMDAAQVKEMSDYGIEMGGHTQTHVDLLKVDSATGKREILGNKEDVQKLTNKAPLSFAYPYGAIGPDVKNHLREAGYKYAVSTNKGPDLFNEDLFQVKRIEIRPKTTLRSFKRKVSGKYFEPSFFSILFKIKATINKFK